MPIDIRFQNINKYLFLPVVQFYSLFYVMDFLKFNTFEK